MFSGININKLNIRANNLVKLLYVIYNNHKNLVLLIEKDENHPCYAIFGLIV